MLEKKQATSKNFIQQELKGTKTQVAFVMLFLLVLSLWHSYLTIQVHKNYQRSLMDTVSSQVANEFENHLQKKRQEIDEFQWRYQKKILHLQRQGKVAVREDYIELFMLLREEIQGVKLFSIIDIHGNGLFKHITGDFLPDCKEEINSTIDNNGQEHLFLHRSAQSVHYDLLQPLIGAEESMYLFVAFDPVEFKTLLKRHRLPQQELFLLRKDSVGKVELSPSAEGNSAFDTIIMTDSEISTFSFLKEIPNTRWSVAIRLEESYSQDLVQQNYLRTLGIWAVISILLLIGYVSTRAKTLRQFKTLQHLEFIESHDRLTGLMNRQSFLEYFQSIKGHIDDGVGVALVIDIDKFEMINNALGFSKGDLCLRLVSELIANILPKDAKFSRISNDQFSILLPNLSHEKGSDLANLISKNVRELNLSDLSDNLSITCCVGVVNINDEFVDGEHVISALLLTLRLAKSNGRNTIQLYQSNAPELIKHAEEMEIYKSVKRALFESGFMLFRQELRHVDSGKQGRVFEVLLRLTTKSGEMISPALFIPIAEEHSLAVELDKWVIDQTLYALSKDINSDVFNEMNQGDHYCINLSGQTLADASMVSYVKDKLSEYEVQPNKITFEITETYAITHLESAIHFINEISDFGCLFALDDFGSGLSSFSYLQRLPVQKLKIDGVFVKDITNNTRNQAFVKTMVLLAKSMGMETVAEFVETESEYEMLKTLGIDYCQGYYFHRPESWVAQPRIK